jgi:hypothetical protein
MVRRGAGTTEESPDLKDCVKWRNDKKEWWIHPTDKWVAHHLTNKGKDINLAYHKNFKIHSTGAARGTNKTWTIGTSGRHVTRTGLQNFLLKQLGIERAHITSIALAKVPKPTATEEKPHESDEQASEQTQIIRWDIIFAKPELCTLWSTLTDKWVLTAIEDQPREAKTPLTLKHATGWTTCKERIVDMMTAPDSDPSLTSAESIIKEVLRFYTDADGNFRSPGHHRDTADALPVENSQGSFP